MSQKLRHLALLGRGVLKYLEGLNNVRLKQPPFLKNDTQYYYTLRDLAILGPTYEAAFEFSSLEFIFLDAVAWI